MAQPTSGGQIYKSLDLSLRQIRLLHLRKASTSDDNVSCQLLTVSLQHSPTFYALSYVWRDPTISGNIEINGKVTPVTANLESALRYMRMHISRLKHFSDQSNVYSNAEQQHADKLNSPANHGLLPVFLWVDAICINQQDLSERFHQVSMMADLYRTAEGVLAWVVEPGKPSENQHIHRAFNIIHRAVLALKPQTGMDLKDP
ncbi:hypothetical protein BX600DRAFT_528029 [Xylariales sp. PMI_506]|nr:hypothetical protein BX600DRAFT_528029 [Xylariales sp. PMI_506]